MITYKRLRSVLNYNEKTGKFTWINLPPHSRFNNGDIAGHTHAITGYHQIKIDSKCYLAHRLAWLYTVGKMPVDMIDHINNVKTDNSWANLREATRSENSYNSKTSKANKSGVKGVCWDKSRKKWYASIRHAKKTYSLGMFDLISDAASAVRKKRAELHGEFANHG